MSVGSRSMAGGSRPKLTGLFWQLLEADNDVLLGGLPPAAGGNQRRSNLLELGIIKDSDGALLHVHRIASINQCLGRGGGEGGAVLKRLVL